MKRLPVVLTVLMFTGCITVRPEVIEPTHRQPVVSAQAIPETLTFAWEQNTADVSRVDFVG